MLLTPKQVAQVATKDYNVFKASHFLEKVQMIKEKAFDILCEYNPYGGALENHCIRLGEFAIALAARESLDLDYDLIYAGAYLHDIGLLVADDDSPNYLYRGVAFTAPLLDAWGLDAFQKQQMRDMLLYNHSFRTVTGITPMGEVLRRAVQVEHSLGKWSHGLERGVIKNIFRTYPRRGLNAILADFARISFKRDGVGEIYRLFFPATSEAE